jgi:hypothetical protein
VNKETCLWYEDGDDSQVWATECKKYFHLDEGTPEENEFKFCPFCGNEILAVDDDDDYPAPNAGGQTDG